MKWEFYTWVPLLSRLLPNDICRIYKTDTAIRLDSTIGDFTEMQWSRGDISFIYNGETAEGLSVVALDNKKKIYQRLSLNNSESVDGEVEDRIDMLMTRPIVYANMSTQPINVTRAQTGFLFFKSDRTDQVGNYTADVYNITDLILISRKRREHLTPEQIKHFEELSKQVESGNIAKELEKEMTEAENSTEDNESSDSKEHCISLPPPPPSSMTWDQYLSSSRVPSLGRKMDLRVDRRSFRSTVYMCKDCPIEMKKLLDILEVIAPYKHFHKLRQFVNLKLPPGFPVKLEIPVFPTVTAIITLQSYKTSQFPPSHFLIPRDYTEFKDSN
ncbi:PREDICTED: ankyrin repeat domain-containing protein 13C-A-like [Amphimedon queenslandica]|uniref:Ankyrin repeat domain-containing protein n=1 Tax=Amphimedon queenslandica TaxID=400682 RepID=A0AAN0JCL2_AMPQE|nr:PREDICTED: ankyrin repeat domain-containing protein 13C-A-like [Amphimedon queenslandica]|eukprot:XP_019854512.1 PREDICTED: ankyrin repeat domain-containing protein 13C-A-like [Amphimedon queenslandica]